MIYKVHIPTHPLNRFVSHFNYYKDHVAAHRLDRFLPNGNIEIVIDLTNFPKYIYDNETFAPLQACNRIWISGIRNKYITIPSSQDMEMFVINFCKGMVAPFIKMPLSGITDRVIDGDLILDGIFLELRSRIQEARSADEMFKLAERLLLKKFVNNLHFEPCIEYAVKRITDTPDSITVKKLADKTGYSSKHFISLFKEYVGVAPKSFMRIIRFQKAIEEIEGNSFSSWTSLAIDCGYYDQAHFISDFKNFSGFTPREYMKKKNGELNYVPVG